MIPNDILQGIEVVVVFVAGIAVGFLFGMIAGEASGRKNSGNNAPH